MSSFEETGPLRPPSADGPTEPLPGMGAASRQRWWLWLGGIVLFGVVVLGAGAWSGYASGLNLRGARESAERSAVITEQFDLGVQDLVAGRYELARQRFDYILQIDPDYTPARELLGEALIALNEPTPTPSFTPSPTLDISPTPTLNLSSLDGLFGEAQTAHANADWDTAANILATLIGQAPEFRRGEVDQLLFSTLRNRGLEKIWAGDQELGIYDLTLAERLFPLDTQAESWRRSAAFYLFANSYYGLDWALATRHFSGICDAGIWDGCFKYAEAAWEFGKKLVKDDDPCGAVVQYDASLRTRDDDARSATATEVSESCLTATAPAPTPTPSATLDLTITVIPTATLGGPPTVTPTLGPTATPTETPIPAATTSPTPEPTDTPPE